MEWHYALLLILAGLFVLMLSGMPIAICFLTVDVFAYYFMFGGGVGIEQLVSSCFTTLNTFILLPIPLFVLMGEIMFRSGIAPVLIETVDKWLGRLPGRLSLLSVGAGTLFSTLTGTSLASVAMLGAVLVPEMEARGYKKSMALGPILGSGGLAMMIPPSALAVLCGAIAEISIGRLLIAIVLPGLCMAAIYALYIVLACLIKKDLAPAYEIVPVPFSEKILATLRFVVPQSVVVFLVIGVIFLGIATPSEAAATGTIGTIGLASLYGRMSYKVFRDSVVGTLRITGMLFLIMAGAAAFSQILSFIGATAGLAELVSNLNIGPISIVLVMQAVVLVLGGFMDVVSIMMVTLPIFMPIVKHLDLNPVWFAVLFLINIEIAGISPPFGMSLFVMKGVAGPSTTLVDIYKAAIPFVCLSALVMLAILALPDIALWLPSLMR